MKKIILEIHAMDDVVIEILQNVLGKMKAGVIKRCDVHIEEAEG